MLITSVGVTEVGLWSVIDVNVDHEKRAEEILSVSRHGNINGSPSLPV